MDTASLSATFEAASGYAEWATIVVAIGVFIELGALFVFSRTMPPAEKAVLVFATALITAGCIGEYIFGSRANHAATSLQQASDRTVAALKTEQEKDHKIAAQAAAHAADLGVTVNNLRTFVTQKEKDADEQLAAFKKFADDEKSQTTNLIAQLNGDKVSLDKARDDAQTAANEAERTLAIMAAALKGRDLTPAQQTDFKQRLEPLAPLRVDIFTFGDSQEIAAFARKLAETLEIAGWKPKIWSVFSGASFGVTGVPIVARTETADKAAKALVEALIAANVSAKQFPTEQGFFKGNDVPMSVNGPPWDANDVADLRIFVGAK